MPKQIYKILAIVLVIGLNWGGVSAVGYTIGAFNDVEDSNANIFKAGVIDFSLHDLKFDPVEPSINLGSGNVAHKIIDIIPLHSNPFQYYVKSDNFSGDSDFCNALGVDVELEKDKLVNTGTIYSGSLQDLLTDATTTLEKFNYDISVGANNLQNKVCNFDLVYNGWQTRHNYPTYENGGFSDTESVPNSISSWGLRLNKIYYDVASDRGKEGDNEWVEVYNQTNVPLDISGWDICDNTSCDTIPANTGSIPANGYGVITATSTTWGYWFVPSEVVKIVLDDARIGNGLGNNGDALYLKRPDGFVVDQMNWQSNTDVWSPGAPDVAEGNVLARVPSGYDTDQASDWVELVPPAVDMIYPDEAGSYAWYWGNTYNIQWTATNPNGDDADLAIDLYYVKDTNHDGVISEGDTRVHIVKGTENDGSYEWTLPRGFIGYIWVELVATGPENPMLNTRTISGDIWDPLPIYVFETNTDEIIDALTNPKDDGGEVIDNNEIVNGKNPADEQPADGVADENSVDETDGTSDGGVAETGSDSSGEGNDGGDVASDVTADEASTAVADTTDNSNNNTGGGGGGNVVSDSDDSDNDIIETTKEGDEGGTKGDTEEKDDNTASTTPPVLESGDEEESGDASTTPAVLESGDEEQVDSKEETASSTPTALSDGQGAQTEDEDTASTTPIALESEESVASSTPVVSDEKTDDNSGTKKENQPESKDVTKDVRKEDIIPEIPKSSENSDIKDVATEESVPEKQENITTEKIAESQPEVDESTKQEQEPSLDPEPVIQQDPNVEQDEEQPKPEQEKAKDIPIKLIVKSI